MSQAGYRTNNVPNQSGEVVGTQLREEILVQIREKPKFNQELAEDQPKQTYQTNQKPKAKVKTKKQSSHAVLTVFLVTMASLLAVAVIFFMSQIVVDTNVKRDNSTKAAPIVNVVPTKSLDKITLCGNKQLELGEACDDGDLVNGDGCSSSCQLEK